MAIKYLNALAINGNGGTVLDVQGSQGQLFSVTDSLTGDIFAVSDISGVPILKVNSSGLVTVDGPFTQTGGGATTLSGTLNVDGEAIIGSGEYLSWGTSGATAIEGSTVSDKMRFYTDSTLAFTLDASQNATFAGNVTVKDGALFYGANAIAASGESGQYVASFGKSTSGSAKFAGNITVGSGNSTFAGNVTLTSGVLSISGDGSNAATLTESSAGILTIAAVDDIILDAEGDIALDANGGDIRLRDGGTTFGTFTKSGDNFHITSNREDGYIKFFGNDGGTSVTALTLNMADGGDATFSADIFSGSTTKTTSNVIRSLAADTVTAGFEAYGANQGTGYAYVGQSASHGGGMFYNGDGTPTFATGETADRVSFYRRTNNANIVVFDYAHNSNTVNFKGEIYAESGSIVLGGTGRIQGVDTVTDSTDAANKAYVDAHGGGLGPFLPLAGGTMSGAINMAGNGITGSNYNISGVNQLTINDPGEGIVFTGTANVNLYVIDDTTDSIVNFDNASEIRRNGVRVADVPYIASRSQQLMTNYNGLLGNNYNFPGWTFDGQEANYSPGSFKFVGSSGNSFTSEYIAVDTAYKYKMSLDAKTLNGVGRYYCMTLCYDVDQNQINANNHMYRANTSTTLAVALNPGDTTVTLAGTGSSWYNGGTAGVSTHLRSLIIWEYTNSLGYTYPPETYSRLYYGNAWDPGDISGNVITLRTAWTGPSYPVGTQLSNGSSGGSYKYNVMSNKLLTTDWTQSVGFMDGVDLSGTNVSTKFPPGTAKIRMGFLPNYNSGSTGADTIWITNFNVGIDTVLTKGDQSIAGTKTFTTVPVVGTMATADDSTSAASTAWVKDQAYITSASLPTVGDGEINGATSGLGITGSMSATANQAGNTTFTVTSNAVTAATASTIAYRDGSADLNVRLLRANYANQSTISGAMAFRVNNGADNYTRYCSSSSAIRTFLGVPASGDLGNYLPLAGGTMTGTIAMSNNRITSIEELRFNNGGNISNQINTDIDSAAAEVVAQVSITDYTAAFFDFVVKKGTNVRSGTVYACHDGTNVEFTETSTNDLGDTSDVTLSVDKTSTNLRLIATVTSNDWSVKSLIRAI